MNVTGLVCWVQDNTLSVKFYKKLGFSVVESNDRHSIVSLGEFSLTLVSMRDEEEFNHDSLTSDRGRGMYLYIHVPDVDHWYEQVLAKGLQPAAEPRSWDWGNRKFVLKDPDGYKLCFWHEIKS